MADGDGWTSRLITGLAEYLAANGIGAWRPNGPAYNANETAIVDRDMPPQPDRVITLADYPVINGLTGMADHTTGVQIWVRGTTSRLVCRDIGDQVFDLLDSATRLTLGGIPIVQIYRQSYTSLGKDGNGRWEASHNYYVEAMRPTANRTD